MNNKNYFRLAVMMMLLLGVATSCAVTDVDRRADFSRYRTFGWGKASIEVRNPALKGDLIENNLRATVEREFAKRGIVYSENDPDFVINYHTYTEQKQETTPGSFYGGYPFFPMRYGAFMYGWGPWAMPFGWGGTMPRTYTYTEGTLVLDIVDADSEETVWRGVVSGNVNNVSSIQKQLEKGIKAIVKKYPKTRTSDQMII